MFKKAYPNEKDPLTYTNLTKAIAAFERTLITPAPFDKYLAGDFCGQEVAPYVRGGM